MRYEPLISLENINFSYTGDEAVLRDISIEVWEGEKILLVGPSGCGKSTLGLILARLAPEHVYGEISGAAYYRPDVARRIGIVFQDPESQFVTFRVMDEVAFGPENLGFKPRKIERVVKRALEFVNMLHKQNELLSNLSGGEKQRIALASVIAMEPEFLIFDEPTSMLDPAATEHFLSFVPQVKVKGMLIIEHKIDTILEAVDRVVAMSPDGEIAFSGTVSEVFVGHFNELITHGTAIPRSLLLIKEFEKYGLLKISVSGFIPTPESVARKLIISGIAGRIRKLPRDFFVIKRRSKGENVLLRAQNLVYTYSGGVRAVNNASLEVREGEVVAVVGRNGSGKTTLMDLLAGIKKPDMGVIEFMGREQSDYSPDEYYSLVGYVFQNPEHQFIMPTVYEEIAFELKKLGFKGRELREKAEEFIERLLLQGKETRNPFRLSQGEKRRLSLGTALIGGKKLVILDEPTFGQDRRAALRLIELGKELSDYGTSMIIVTHDIDVAFEECDRIIVMSLGEIIWDGPPDELIQKEDIMGISGLRLPIMAQISRKIEKAVPGFPTLVKTRQWESAARLLSDMEEVRH